MDTVNTVRFLDKFGKKLRNFSTELCQEIAGNKNQNSKLFTCSSTPFSGI